MSCDVLQEWEKMIAYQSQQVQLIALLPFSSFEKACIISVIKILSVYQTQYKILQCQNLL